MNGPKKNGITEKNRTQNRNSKTIGEQCVRGCGRCRKRRRWFARVYTLVAVVPIPARARVDTGLWTANWSEGRSCYFDPYRKQFITQYTLCTYIVPAHAHTHKYTHTHTHSHACAKTCAFAFTRNLHAHADACTVQRVKTRRLTVQCRITITWHRSGILGPSKNRLVYTAVRPKRRRRQRRTEVDPDLNSGRGGGKTIKNNSLRVFLCTYL